VRFFRRAPPPVWHDPSYRLPIGDAEAGRGLEPRRADFVLWHLVRAGVLLPGEARAAAPVSFADLGRVHTPELLESLTRPETLARVFAIEGTVPVDAILGAVRIACGATIEATRAALARGGPAVNLMGGFHHAAPDRAGGMCAVNDVAVAVAVARAEGLLAGRVAILDLDAHPPDGLAACFQGDGDVWIGSLSGSDWAPLGGEIHETVLPAGCDDARYLAALDELLAHMPRAALTFVIAGGDVLAGDRLGRLGLTLDGTWRRDRRVARALAGRASVWLPGGGYHPDAWRVLAGAVEILAGRRRPARTRDPLGERFADVAGALGPTELAGVLDLTEEDVLGQLGAPRPGPPRLLGYYTREGIELALEQYGILAQLARLGYGGFRVTIDPIATGDRFRLYGSSAGAEHLLVEADLARGEVAGRSVLFVNWLTLRHPLGSFGANRPRLPGQDAPGLGIAPETTELLARMAARLGLAGVAFRPSWFHVAFALRRRMRFADPARQGRFEALVRDLGATPPVEATRAIAAGELFEDGAPYQWEADDMVLWLDGGGPPEPAVARERDRVHFQRHA
jgi:acetoin utilization deacetylase AcuC-like enzyme